MKIAYVTKRPCIRLVKQAIVLRNLGHEITLVSPDMIDTSIFSMLVKWDNNYQLHNAVTALEKSIDVWVVHNEPTWPVAVIREALPKAPIVLDYHDSLYWYYDSKEEANSFYENISWYEEDVGVELSDGFVVGSQGSKDELKTRTDKPIAVTPPAVPRGMYKFKPHDFSGGLVIQGGVSVPGYYGRIAEHFRDYTRILKYLKGRCDIFVYSPCFKFDPEYEVDKYYMSLLEADKRRIGSFPYDEMLEQLGRHSWNFVGNWIYHMVWEYSAPNKFYDGLASGIPSFVINNKSAIEIIKATGMGLVGDHPQILLDNWDSHKEARANVMRYRSNFCMEAFIDNTIKLYEEVINGK